MKALTISQPWPDKIIRLEKWVENRTWAHSYRGPLALHAGLGTQYLNKNELKNYVTGAVVGIARLAAIVLLKDVIRRVESGHKDSLILFTTKTWRQVLEHQHSEGPVLWILEDVRAIEPIKATGKQGLWEWDIDLTQIRYIDSPGTSSSPSVG